MTMNSRAVYINTELYLEVRPLQRHQLHIPRLSITDYDDTESKVKCDMMVRPGYVQFKFFMCLDL